MTARRPARSGTPATVALTSLEIWFCQHTYRHDSGRTDYGQEATQSLGLSDERVLKTLVVVADDVLGVAVIPVSRQLDLKAFATELGCKRASLADPAVARRATGFEVGGISPLGQRRRLPTIVDRCAVQHRTVLVSGGRRGLSLELSPVDLLRATGGHTAPITR